MKKKNNSGISAVPLIFALVLLISLGAFFISLMLGKHIGAPLLAQTTKAFYIADAGIEFTAIYLRGFAGDADWTDGISDIASTSFGDGNFAVAFTNKTQNSVIATSTGTISNARRDISIKFTRLAVLMPNPVNWLSTIELTDTVTVNGSTCSPPDCSAPPATCPCTNIVTLAQAPPPPQPTGVTWSNLEISGGTYTFNAGTYYFDELRIRNGAVVTVNGPVTIWIRDRFRLRDASTQFNWGGNAADLLLLSAGTSTVPADPEFEIRAAQFRGAIYGPNPEVEVEIRDDAQIVGAIVGNEVELEDTTITFDSSAGLNAMIKASGWGEM